MAQMTVAVALSEQEADSVQLHFQDTLKAGRGLCNEALAELVCEDGPKRIREMAQWGTRWARQTVISSKRWRPATVSSAAATSTFSIPVPPSLPLSDAK